ncbi:sirohydrochlorin chelatase [Candidatus Atelocyanobacterium thalassae]|uniref:Cobalamin biosynthesis protein CbiX n=1 Tax=cyanobacterium endosymbiont of Braarudosphaera bigelowii TaxID=1285375 RepID=A0ABM7U5J1_9CHRO|nr:CbiX/SirB N-terminal domain-containing protein [Candidatus Atelocyanobacterium thalassa]BDA39632.1 hypothetical protein CPARK_000047100 [cyanobacterium endosymbiont of Braarudosphaera bigelowii]
MISTSAYLLVVHGSHNLQYKTSLKRLSYLISWQLNCLHTKVLYKTSISYYPTIPQIVIVETATLELSQISLAKKIQQFASKIKSYGIKNLKIIPMFLFPGIHVKQDIPLEVSIAQRKIGNFMNLELCSHLGNYKGLVNILSDQFLICSQMNARIIISHGSNFQDGNNTIEGIANRLNATTAYWGIKPNLSDQINILLKQNKVKITIIPYFLFRGKITNIITQQIQKIQSDLPGIQINLGYPIGETFELVKLIVDEIVK